MANKGHIVARSAGYNAIVSSLKCTPMTPVPTLDRIFIWIARTVPHFTALGKIWHISLFGPYFRQNMPHSRLIAFETKQVARPFRMAMQSFPFMARCIIVCNTRKNCIHHHVEKPQRPLRWACAHKTCVEPYLTGIGEK